MKPDESTKSLALPEDATRTTSCCVYSVVIPFYNEKAAAPSLLQEVLTVLARLDGPSECLCVDDGSNDGTAAALNPFVAKSVSTVRILTFPKNRGQAAALWAGLHEARGSIVITLDGDGQNDPADIPDLLQYLDHADLVCGIRAERNDTALRRAMSRLANRVRGSILGDNMRDSGCGLKVMRREVVEALVPIRTLYSFIPAMAIAGGFRIAEVPVRHRARNGGRSTYGFLKFALMPFVDMLGLFWFRKRCVQVRDSVGPRPWGAPQ
ncbi:MAG: glycosyltransferase family 2 protein [Verrucomicrobiota bacterium]|nr:glycosyltransferase family 2 protein [Verrucomicrobiota bacterium]MDD8050220.1 glycosyltransferase family 2 protein [Verrucomicrobiota bacterium]